MVTVTFGAEGSSTSVMLPAVMPAASTIAELARAAQRGDRAAYGELYARMQGAAHAVVLARVPPSDVPDVLQETFVTAWIKLPELREPAAFPGWVLEIARRSAKAERRKKQKSSVESEDRAAELSVAPVPAAEANEALLKILALPEAYRETLLMRLVHGMSGPEIALATGLSPDSVRVNLCRGMKLLRGDLEGSEG
jgi:RNA polymerase sigma-70 factor (ECF subfamily)